MSRCFPYPPPGYVRNGARGDSLIQSIEREREKANTKQRKEKKREKKEKRKERKQEERVKIHDISDEKVKQLSNEKSHKGEKRKDETDQLERSGLTEEHGQAVYLSDGSQSSKKRKRHTSPSNGSQNHRNIIRIRLSLRKHREPDESFSEEQLCSTSGREEPLAQQKEVVLLPRQELCCSIKTDTVKLTPEPNKELHCSDVAEIASLTMLYENQMKRAESQYKALIEDWVPPPLQFGLNDSDDQEWLFGTKQQERHGCKRLKAENDVSCHASASLWPRAQYLPEADIYALPYTIPF